MKLEKINSFELDKCYAIQEINYKNKRHIVVAAEKVNKCLLFDIDGNYEETIWDEPGGTMSIVAIPGGKVDGQFLATHEFYSPNDSANSKIMIVTPKGKDNWEKRVLAQVPFVHRFDILTGGGKNYLIACTLKSDHEFKNDWNHPGKILIAELPEDLSSYNIDNQLQFTVIKEGLTKNHGYCHCNSSSGDYALIGSENGIFKVTPPSVDNSSWQILHLFDKPASDMAQVDFDQDGKLEIIRLSPFHGKYIDILKEINGKYETVYSVDEPKEFAHSIWAGKLYDQSCAIIGHRQGNRDILRFFYQDGKYQYEVLAQDVGSTNVYRYEVDGEQRLVSTNREINEIAFYKVME